MRKSLRLILALAPLLALAASPCYANPLNPDFPISRDGPSTLLFYLCPVIEAVIILFIFRGRFVSFIRMVAPFLLIVLLNFVTILATLRWASDLLQPEHTRLVYLAEILPLVVEPLALMALFYILYRMHVTSRPASVWRILLAVLLANVVTFLLGLAFYEFWPAPYNMLSYPG